MAAGNTDEPPRGRCSDRRLRMLVATRRKDPSWFALLPQAILAGLLAWISAGIGTMWLAGELAKAPGPDADFAYLATSRTAVLCMLAVLMAWFARKYSLRELGWLVYPLLVGEGMRLLLEDIRYGRPSTLFVTLAFYGGALVRNIEPDEEDSSAVTAYRFRARARTGGSGSSPCAFSPPAAHTVVRPSACVILSR